MINDLDETIRQLLLKKGAFDPSEVDINFETPDREWSASVSKPTINVYLYDIRENHQLRGTEWTITKDNNGNATRKKNPARIDLSYLVTVWTSDIVDEHSLLWHTLFTLFRYPELPAEILSGRLAEQQYSIKTLAVQPDGLFHNPADFWSALDNEIKPSINYVVTVPIDPDIEFTAPIVRTKILDVNPPDTAVESLVQVTGTVYKAGKQHQSVPGVMVLAKESGMTAVTDDEGNYAFSKLRPGKHIFRVLTQDLEAREFSVTVPDTSYDLEL